MDFPSDIWNIIKKYTIDEYIFQKIHKEKYFEKIHKKIHMKYKPICYFWAGYANDPNIYKKIPRNTNEVNEMVGRSRMYRPNLKLSSIMIKTHCQPYTVDSTRRCVYIGYGWGNECNDNWLFEL